MTRALTTRAGPRRALPPHHPHAVGAGLKPAFPVACGLETSPPAPRRACPELAEGVSHSVSLISHSASLVSHSASLVPPTVSHAKAE